MNVKPTPWKPIQQNETKLLPARPNHPFYYKFHPSNWNFAYFDIETTPKGKKTPQTITKGFFIPQVRMERVVPGVNGIHQISGEMGDPSSRIGKLQQQGWVYLSPDRFDYMSIYQVRGGRYHVPKWMEIKVVAGTLIEKMDTTAFNRWSVELLLNGVFKEPEPHFWELAILNARKSPERLQQNQHIPEIKRQMEGMYSKIKDMQSFLEEYSSKGLEVYNPIIG